MKNKAANKKRSIIVKDLSAKKNPKGGLNFAKIEIEYATSGHKSDPTIKRGGSS